ncbi:hypothetical protein BVC80_7757g6 [Macleaya cordata]|uniref:RNase H type-1 domain-containing protein n=1 Tax=Macleaya cordata TaxID=56857 RepID=A0A200QKI9_MACCD|nr:hypothetical protein BVC80_7757g6 [Macleaya cordata]
MECDFARAVWFASPYGLLLRTDWDDNDHDWAAICAIFSWHIWKARCSTVFQSKSISPLHLGREILKDLSQYANPKEHISRTLPYIASIEPPTPASWSLPNFDYLKINFDGSFTETNLAGGSGFICCDSTGTFCGAGAGPTLVLLAGEAESAAALSTITWAKEMSKTNIILEGDSKQVIDYINGSGGDYFEWRCKPILDKVRELKATIPNCQCNYTARVGNKAADTLSKYGRSLSLLTFWINSHPLFITDVINMDYVTMLGHQPLNT